MFCRECPASGPGDARVPPRGVDWDGRGRGAAGGMLAREVMLRTGDCTALGGGWVRTGGGVSVGGSVLVPGSVQVPHPEKLHRSPQNVAFFPFREREIKAPPCCAGVGVS